jgi:hypothetical protein
MLISQMSDEHLTAYIKLICRGIIETKDRARKPEMIDEYETALYGGKKLDPEKAARHNREAIENLYPYLAEAFLRNLSDAQIAFQVAVGRAGAIGSTTGFLLPESLDDNPF